MSADALAPGIPGSSRGMTLTHVNYGCSAWKLDLNKLQCFSAEEWYKRQIDVNASSVHHLKVMALYSYMSHLMLCCVCFRWLLCPAAVAMEAPGSSHPSPLAVHRFEVPQAPSQDDTYLTQRNDNNTHCGSPLLGGDVPSTSSEAVQGTHPPSSEVPLLAMDLPPEPSSPPPDYNVVVGQDGKTGLMLHASYSHLNLDNKSDSVSMNLNICRICHMPGDDTSEGLISPCRCAGTLQFIHNTCLMVSALLPAAVIGCKSVKCVSTGDTAVLH